MCLSTSDRLPKEGPTSVNLFSNLHPMDACFDPTNTFVDNKINILYNIYHIRYIIDIYLRGGRTDVPVLNASLADLSGRQEIIQGFNKHTAC